MYIKKMAVTLFVGLMLSLSGCVNPDLRLKYLYYDDQEKVLLDGIDYETTMQIAELELAEGGNTSIITIWFIRDQILTPELAARINDLYFQYIDSVSELDDYFYRNFSVWHFTWAMSNIYRNGNDDVKDAIRAAYEDAKTRPAQLDGFFRTIADSHVNGRRVVMGDAHEVGRRGAQTHVVIPSNPDYISNIEEYWDARGDGIGYAEALAADPGFQSFMWEQNVINEQ